MNLNKVILIGRMAADPETRTTPSGQSVSSFRIATNRVWNDRNTGQKQEQVEFHSIVAWGQLSNVVQSYLKKGQLVEIEGRLQTRSWQGNDGVKKYRTEIVAENLQLGPKAAGTSFQNDSGPRPSSPSKPEPDEEDIPVINEDSPTAGVSDESPDSNSTDNSNSGVDESEVDLKDIPF
ncbi:MAG: single-stranded DNA-binding protein [Parcubacteria group bacterium]